MGTYKHLLYKNGEYGYITVIKNQDLVPKMNSNQDNGIKLESSTIWPGYEPYLAFDKSNSEKASWATEAYAGGKGWLSIEFPSKENINKYSLISRMPVTSINEMPRKWTFEALDEKGSWVVLDSREGQVFTQNVKREFTFDNNEHFIKYKLNILENGGSFTYSYVDIGEIELFGTKIGFASLGTSLPTEEQFEQYGVEDLTDWLPYINTITGEKKIITKSTSALKALNIDANAPLQFIKQLDSIDTSKDKLNELVFSAANTSSIIKVGVQFPDVDNKTYVYKNGAWTSIEINNVTSFEQAANTLSELEQANWNSSLLKNKVRFIYAVAVLDSEGVLSLKSITLKSKSLSNITPKVSKANVRIKAFSLDGYMKDVERLNTINFAKLSFKADAVIASKENGLHQMVVDTVKEDTITTLTGGTFLKDNVILATSKSTIDGMIYEEFTLPNKKLEGVKE